VLATGYATYLNDHGRETDFLYPVLSEYATTGENYMIRLNGHNVFNILNFLKKENISLADFSNPKTEADKIIMKVLSSKTDF